MTIRKVMSPEEIRAGAEISYTSFHVRGGNIDEEVSSYDPAASVQYAAFDDDGNMMAHVYNNLFRVRFDGHEIPCGGIGGVSTLPEYRSTGAVKHIFRELLHETREKGEVLSALFPFKHSFYRKFGYDTVTFTTYTLPPSALSKFRHDGWVKQWHPGETACLFKDVYDRFARDYNLSFVRDAEMKKHINGDPLADRRFAYLIGNDDGPCAYAAFTDEYHDPQAHMRIRDCAFVGRAGLYSLLGFLARFEADYGSIAIHLPEDVDLLKLVDAPYSVTGKRECGFMVRAVNAQETLRLMAKPADAEFTIRIADDFLDENSGTFLVRGESVERTTLAPDIEIDIRALAPMALGITPLGQAYYRKDVDIISNHETLKRVFVAKSVYFAEHF